MPIVTGLNANVFRAVSGSLFSSPVNWSRGVVPTGSDVAIVSDNCTIDISRTIGTLVVRPGFTASINTGLTLRVNDVINVMGHLSCSGAPNIVSFAGKNIINSLSPGTSTFTYTGSYQQSVAGGPYYNLNILGNALKKTNANLITSGAVIINKFANLDLGPYDLDALGTIYMGAVGDGDGTLSKSQPGNIKIGGLLSVDTHATNVKGLDFSGNPTVELKGGISSFNASGQAYTGMGLLRFTTNNQTITPVYGAINFYNPIQISGSIAVTASGVFSSGVILNNTISSAGSSSTFLNSSVLYFNYQPSYDLITGSLDITSSAGNLVGYIFNGNAILPYTNYQSLQIRGIGTKTLKGNTIVSGSLSIPGGNGDFINATILELSSSNLIVSGSTTIGTSFNRGVLSRQFQGSTVFIGPVAVDVSNSEGPGINFSASNADIEFRNGFSTYDPFSKIRTGTGSWYFTTNNQNLVSSFGTVTLDSRLIVSGAITLTSSFVNLVVTNIINGTDPNSRFINRGALYFATSASLNTSLTTGSFDFSSSINTVVVGGNYDGTIPARFSSSFYNLTINGTGVKTLATSSVILNSLINNTNGTFELGNHDLFVSGTTIVGDGATNIFRKSGPGNITFGGEIARLGWNSGVGTFDLSGGNPNVEVRRGIRTLGANTSTFKSGFGTWSFAVNNQRIYLDNFAVPSSLTFSGSVLIKDGITLTIDPYGANGGFPGLGGGMAVVIMKDINGTTPSAKLMVSGALYFASSSRSMTIGTIDNTSIGNIIGYISSEPSQSLVYSSNYFNLYIANSGVKYATSSLYMSGGLTITNGGNLDVGTYDMFVSGTTTLQTGSLIKTSSGNITFNGQINTLGFSSILLNTSESKIELRNGINLDFSPIVPNTHTFYFTTNNQIITSSNAATSPSLNNTNFIISGAINLTISPAFQLFFNGYMDGTDLSSKLTIGRGPVPLSPGGGVVYYSSPIMPMATSGTLDASSSLNVFVYNGAAQDIKGGIYRNLTFQGGTKTLRGNVSVLNTLSTGSTVVNLNGFTLTNP
jgi:hypothetical protein